MNKCVECGKGDCTLRCPTCIKFNLGNKFYCSDKCFKKNWNQHKLTHPGPNSIPIAEKQNCVCQLYAILFPTFEVSQIDRFSNLLDSNFYILDGKPRADFSRMWQDIRVKHPTMKGGTMISFPIYVNVQNEEGGRGTLYEGISGPSDALVNFLSQSGIQAERGVEFQALVPWSNPAEWKVGWNFVREQLSFLQL